MRRLKRLFLFEGKNPTVPDDWREKFVSLWEEDDARPPGAEQPGEAFSRITRLAPKDFIAKRDYGDHFVYFYRGGWVKRHHCDGVEIGVLVTER
jgi:hypothetical protein